MNLKLKITILFLTLYVLSCNSEDTASVGKKNDKTDSAGAVEWYDNSSYGIIDSNASVEVIGKNFNWSEGPVWIAQRQILLFSDVPENKIFQWKQGDSASVYLTPSGIWILFHT